MYKVILILDKFFWKCERGSNWPPPCPQKKLPSKSPALLGLISIQRCLCLQSMMYKLCFLFLLPEKISKTKTFWKRNWFEMGLKNEKFLHLEFARRLLPFMVVYIIQHPKLLCNSLISLTEHIYELSNFKTAFWIWPWP